jgi:hypothetical protein
MFNGFPPKKLLLDAVKYTARWVLFLYLLMVLCPVRYWPFNLNDWDNTWVFALNYGVEHHLVFGRDIDWTSGPLAYLAAPMDIGNNLAAGLLFQAALWIVLCAILWDVFFRGSAPLKNLAFFSLFVGLSGPQYHHLPNPLGPGGLLFVGGLILLVQFHLRGGLSRYVTALVMLGIFPLIQFVGVMLVAGVLGGYVIARALQDGWGARRDIALAAIVPTLVSGMGYWLSIGSWSAFVTHITSSLQLATGYNVAMALPGGGRELQAVFGAAGLLALAIIFLAKLERRRAVFLSLLFVGPLLINVKHATVRQDLHIMYVFGFVAVALGLVALCATVDKRFTVSLAVIAAALLLIVSQVYVTGLGQKAAIVRVTGIAGPLLAWHAVNFDNLRLELNARSQRTYTAENRLEPEIKAIVQHETVASLSMGYNNAVVDDLNLVLYPVLQRYSAYTPYLDKLNADWVRDKGPRFLVFDGSAIDGRHPWMETPAMWVEVYRWYDTRALGKYNLLLERRAVPRFTRFETLAHERLRFGEELRVPSSSQPIFWTMHCSLTSTGKLRGLLYRFDEVTMRVENGAGRVDSFRVFPSLLDVPSMGNTLPSDLAQFAAVFGQQPVESFSVDKIAVGGPAMSAYAPECQAELVRPVL